MEQLIHYKIYNLFLYVRFKHHNTRRKDLNLQILKPNPKITTCEVKFKKFNPFTTTNITPFNSQNTFISAKILKHYFMFPFVGRMDDIWGAYVLFQTLNKKPFILFNNATVNQKRNLHNLVDDLNDELSGYKQSQYFLKKNYRKIIPEKSLKAFEIYRSYFK